MRKVAAGIQDRLVRGFLTGEIRGERGRLGFVLETFDRVVKSALQTTPRAVYLIDEIGKIECFSNRFKEAVTSLFDSGQAVIATVAKKGGVSSDR